jgi:hypothetical protein
MLQALGELDGRDAQATWEPDGAYSMAHWVKLHLGLSGWKAERWVDAGVALRGLPLVADALGSGELPIDKVVEITRFADPEEQDALVIWARSVSSGAIRKQGELRSKRDAEEVATVEVERFCDWGYHYEGKGFWLEAQLPPAQGAVVASALDGLASEIPELPGEGQRGMGSRRASALVALCSGESPRSDESAVGPVRAEIVVHAQLEDLLDSEANAYVEEGPTIPTAAVRRLLCGSSVKTVIESFDGTIAGVGQRIREPSPALMRQLRHRDQECAFPGCGARRFTHAHHIDWWSHGGRTDLDNLVLICGHHHRLVHEHGWRVERDPGGDLSWFRPDGTGYRAGPGGDEAAA